MIGDHIHVWNNCLKFFSDNLTPTAFNTWFSPIVPLKLELDTLTIQVPSPFFYEYLEEKYVELLESALHKEIGVNARLEYQVVVDKGGDDKNKAVSGHLNLPGKQMGDKVVVKQQHQQPAIRNPFVIPGIRSLDIDPQLNTAYTFENYIEGKCNRVARSAGVSIANKPGKTPFNPLFVYGESGMGKTHVVQSIGAKVKELYPEKSVLYVTSNQFQTQYTDSVRNNTQNNFLNFYQLIDVLIIDDIQDLAGKTGTQNTFFHIFNHLHQSGKQLILSSDKPPFNLQGMEQRLLSRFKWGLSAELESPDYQTRYAILKHKAYKDSISIPEDVIKYMAENITNSVRELHGAMISLVAQTTFNNNGVITMESAQDIVSKLSKTDTRAISIDKIQNVVCDHFKVEKDVLHSKSRKREIVQVRQIAMYLSKVYTKNSLQTIGREIGKRDHATVLHACKTVNNLMDTDRTFKSNIKELELKLKF